MDRFWIKVDKTPETGCWHWTSTITTEGYGQFWFNRRPRLAHRFAYEMMVGPIPEGLVIDHLCRVRHCVNPSHMEPVTPAENNARGLSLSAANARKTHCKHGHPFTVDNTRFTPAGDRECLTCRRRIDRDRRMAEVVR